MQASSLHVPFQSRVSNAVWNVSHKHWRWVVIAMLVLLHVATLRGVADVWARSLLLAHLGLLLLWQPVLRSEHQVSGVQAGFIALGAVVVMLWLNWWMLAVWVVVLAGLVGGKVFLHQARWQRRFYLLVLVYLLALLAVVILPEIAPRREITAETTLAAEYGLPALFVLLALIPAEPDPPEAAQVIDFFYSVFVMLVLAAVILGSFTFMTVGNMPYLRALTYTVFAIAGGVLIIGLAWNPHTGYAGLNVFFSRYLFSIGLPVENWLYILAELAQMEPRPDRFLAEGVAALARLPWVAGAVWRAGSDNGGAGVKTGYSVQFESPELALTVYSRYRTSPALQWNLHLLGQLLAEFYRAKLREEELQEQSYLQAVHETGARVTHDVKNLLQSLNALCAVATQQENADSPALLGLIRRQLPLIAQRLSSTLARLHRPESSGDEEVALQEWWQALVRQYQGQEIEFDASGLPPGLRVPRALFDSVADNLLQNALGKRGHGTSVHIGASLSCNGGIELRVCDTGHAVAPEVERQLLRAPVTSSSTGLGIGLYQAARHAEAKGYRLSLASNREGEVCFALRGGAPGPA
jgi:signal transduction histidine kinase